MICEEYISSKRNEGNQSNKIRTILTFKSNRGGISSCLAEGHTAQWINWSNLYVFIFVGGFHNTFVKFLTGFQFINIFALYLYFKVDFLWLCWEENVIPVDFNAYKEYLKHVSLL